MRIDFYLFLHRLLHQYVPKSTFGKIRLLYPNCQYYIFIFPEIIIRPKLIAREMSDLVNET